MSVLIDLLLQNPIISLVVGLLIVAILIAVIKKLFKLAFYLSVILIATAIMLQILGYNTLPEEGKKILDDADELLDNAF